MVIPSYDTPAAISTPLLAIHSTSNYATILDAFNLHYKSSEYYWEIGEPHSTREWVLNLSVIKNQLPDLLALIIPILLLENIPFKVIHDRAKAILALDGNLGPEYLGKMVSIYPPTPQDALIIAKKLISLTNSFKGPAIRTDRCLGGIVYTSWGAHIKVPFSLPPDVIWPFTEITTPEIPPEPKLLNFSYYPTLIIKADAKGDIIKALYFKKLWKIRSCIIKQGRQNMFMDNAGRDIRDRLQWQYEVYSKLAKDLPLPKIFDHFSSNGDSYLAMQYINGISFTVWLDKIYNNRLWYNLSLANQTELIDHLLYILNIVQRLHNKGYIHRDITPENFMLDKNKKIWLIDVELMWSRNTGYPTPPGAGGTPGVISAEQNGNRTPTESEDIYAVGALMLAFFSNLMPIKFQQLSGELLKNNIIFFVQNELIATIISDCLEADPIKRPGLSSIISAVNSFRREIQQHTKTISPLNPKLGNHLDHKELRKVIQLAINGLASSSAVDHDSHWMSNMPADSKVIGNEQLGMTVQEGWHRGVAGPLWLIAIARRLGFDTTQCLVLYEQNWRHIQKRYFLQKNSNKTLYEGAAGIALALTEGLDSGLLPRAPHHIHYLENCFSKDAPSQTLAGGIAGQGIGVLYTSHWLQQKYTEELLSSYINSLITKQQADGSWPLQHYVSKPNNYTYNLSHGTPGIIWFLLAFLQMKPDPEVKTITIKSLNWLIKKASKKGKVYTWPDFKHSSPWSSETGTPGIALVLLKAYEVLKIEIYRHIAENILNSIPDRPVIMDFTLGKGLAGIGELYLEAYKVFTDPIWLTRAEWIAQLLLHTLHIDSPNEAIWLPDYQSAFTADLFVGNSGIIHFLMRCLLPNSLAHPLDPIHNTSIRPL